VELLTLTGAAVRAIGNDRANILTGTDLANRLDAHGGDDILYGFGGHDWLDGWGGADQMFGGLGDDKYVVDNVGDVVTENANEGTDLVMSYIDYTLSINLELLTLLGSANVNATGNARANRLIGNSGANAINGMGGDDDLIGGAGNDRFVFAPGAGRDTIQDFVAGGVDDTLDFSAYAGTGVTYSLSQVGANAVFAFSNGDQVTLINVTAANLVQTDPWGWS
jgi:Ca2+-binding RTX toxin-like protein